MASWAKFNGDESSAIEPVIVLGSKLEWPGGSAGIPSEKIFENPSINDSESQKSASKTIKTTISLIDNITNENNCQSTSSFPRENGFAPTNLANDDTDHESTVQQPGATNIREETRILELSEDTRKNSCNKLSAMRDVARIELKRVNDEKPKPKRPDTLCPGSTSRRRQTASRLEAAETSSESAERSSDCMKIRSGLRNAATMKTKNCPEPCMENLLSNEATRAGCVAAAAAAAVSGKQAHRVQFDKKNFTKNSAGDEKTRRQHEQPSPSISTTGSSSNSSSSSSSSGSSEDNSSLGQYSEARPPDGGWGWVVVAASFMVNLIADGITFSFGVIFVEFLNYFGEGKSKTAWIGSLFMAMPLLSGPVASFLTDRYGCRRVSIAGSILATAGFVISSFANSMELLIFTFGVVAGFGLSLCFVAAVVIVAYYFDKKRSFATGLSVCGSGIGTFIFAPVTQYLLDEYGWRGTTLILAGLFLNLAVCGCLMRDLEWTTIRAKAKSAERRANRERRRTRIQSSSVDSFSASSANTTMQTPHGGAGGGGGSGGGAGSGSGDQKRNFASANAMTIENLRLQDIDRYDDEKLFSSLVNLPTFVKNGEKVPLEVLELLSTRKNVYNVLLQNYPSLLIASRSFSDSGTINDEAGINGDRDDDETKNLDSRERKRITMTRLEEDITKIANDEIDGEREMGMKNATDGGKKNWQHQDAAYLWWLRKINPDGQLGRSATLETQRRLPTAYLKDIRVHRHSLTYRGAMLNINRYRLRASSCPDIYRNSMTTIAKTKLVWYAGLWEFWDLVVDMLDFSHFADSRFLLFSMSNFLLHTWYDVPYVYLTDNAIEMGFSETDASILISAIGIMNMTGEIFLGWAGDRAWVNASIVYAVCMILCGAVTGLIPMVVTNYWGLCTVSGAFGLFIAANYSLTSIILVEVITLERFTNAYGLLLLVQGIANLMGPPLAGWLYDITGTYDLSFYLAGFFIALSGFLMMVMPVMEFYRKCKSQKNNERSSTSNKEFAEINSV